MNVSGRAPGQLKWPGAYQFAADRHDAVAAGVANTPIDPIDPEAGWTPQYEMLCLPREAALLAARDVAIAEVDAVVASFDHVYSNELARLRRDYSRDWQQCGPGDVRRLTARYQKRRAEIEAAWITQRALNEARVAPRRAQLAEQYSGENIRLRAIEDANRQLLGSLVVHEQDTTAIRHSRRPSLNALLRSVFRRHVRLALPAASSEAS